MKENDKSITFKCSEELKEALEAAAREQQRPLSNLVKVILSEWLAQHQSEHSAPQSVSGTGTR